MISNAWHDRALGRDVACTEDRLDHQRVLRDDARAHRRQQRPSRDADTGRRDAGPARRHAAGGDHVDQGSRGADARGASLDALDLVRRPARFRDVAGDGRRPAACRSSSAISRPTRSKPTSTRSGSDPCRPTPTSTRISAPVKAARAPSSRTGSRLPTADGQVDPAFYGTWQMSPFADAYLGRMAAAAVADLKLGQGQGTDFLAVSFSALDTVGHAYGPRSHEVQDILVRLDGTIGTLLDELDRQVGRGRYALALTADHGVGPIPQQMQALGLGGGLVDRKTVTTVLTGGARRQRPRQQHRLRDRTCRRTRRRNWPRSTSTNGMRFGTSLEQVDGIARAWRTTDLLAGRYEAASDPMAHAARLSAYRAAPATSSSSPTRIGFLTGLCPRTARRTRYDQHVPLVFAGPQFRRGRYTATASPADIAPTLGRLARRDPARPRTAPRGSMPSSSPPGLAGVDEPRRTQGAGSGDARLDHVHATTRTMQRHSNTGHGWHRRPGRTGKRLSMRRSVTLMGLVLGDRPEPRALRPGTRLHARPARRPRGSRLRPAARLGTDLRPRPRAREVPAGLPRRPRRRP